MKFSVSQNQDGNFSFILNDNEGELILKSVAFQSREACIAAVRSTVGLLLQKNAYQSTTIDGSFYYSLNDGEGNRIGLGEAKNSLDDVNIAINKILDDISDETEFQVEIKTTSTSTITESEVLPSLTEIDFASYYDFGLISSAGKTGFENIKRADNSFSFHFNDTNGSALLYSRSFDSASKRDKRIRQVIKASEKEQRYEIKEENGAFYFVIKEKNNLEITRSRSFGSQADAEAMIAYCKTNIPRFVSEYPEPVKRKAVNEYDFSIKAPSNDVGFHSLRGTDKQHYFVLNDANGQPLLFSQGYSGSGARESGIKTVIKNADDAGHYEIKENKGLYYFVIKSSNKQEIGRSASFSSREDAEKAIAWSVKTLPNYASQYGVDMTKTIKTKISTQTETFTIDLDKPQTQMATEQNNIEREEDNYLACSKYEGHATSPAEGFTTFQDEAGQYYFSMINKSGKVLLRSEGYPTIAARDNGLASVQKNCVIRERYSIAQSSAGHSFLILKAGNHQEIARSCGFKGNDDLLALFPFMADGFTGAISFDEPEVAAATSNNNVDEYLACEAYSGHSAASEAGFTTFQNENGEYYFAVVDANGKVLFRSEGYPTTGARDNGIQSVIKNRDNKDRYKVVEEDGKYYVSLKAGNHQEIARSCAFDSEPNIDALYFAPVVAAALAASSPNIDEYLPCDAYKGHKESPYENFVTFKEGDFYYFAMLDGDGNVKLRSESYPNTQVRDNGLQSVIKNKDIKERYKTIEEDGKHYLILRAGNNQEIARSCPQSSEAGLWALFPYLAGAGALAFGAASAVGSPKPVASGINLEKAAPVVAPTYEEEREAKGGFPKWLWWLLGALLLGALLWWLLKGCSKPVVTVPTDSTAIIAPPVDTIKTEVPPPPPPVEAGCNCDENLHPVFKLTGTPKSLHRLGSNPEYGWSHGLSAAQFYDKLKKAHANNPIDTEHLDGLSKAMGYTNGFSDVPASAFSEVKLPKGTVGNLGYSKKHKWGVYSLDMDKERDLEAFLIQAKNGCNTHIMKTCGNVMFFCQK